MRSCCDDGAARRRSPRWATRSVRARPSCWKCAEEEFTCETRGERRAFRRAALAPPPPPSAPPLLPPPPPPPPPVPTNYVVFFDFNRSDLTPEAMQVVASAASIARSRGMVRIVITGHTDTVGSASYNLRLSERRAQAVKSQLVADGVPEAGITTIGKGLNDPLVPTGPNVREPQNRRAVIDLGSGTTS